MNDDTFVMRGTTPPDTAVLGVVVEIPDPWRQVLVDWRTKCGDPQAGLVPPHVTLLPPTDVPSESLPAIEEHLRVVAMQEQEFDIRLRGSATFRPVSPVVFVPLVQGISECERLESKVRGGPLHREVRFPYHPHVTVAHDLMDDALDVAFDSLASYEADFRVLGFSLFEQGADATWRPQRDFVFGGGGLPGPEEAPPRVVRREAGW